MFTRKALPVGTMFIILVIVLALVGVGYAFWSETLSIKGTVTTGEVDVEFSTYDPVECVDTPEGLCQPIPAEKAGAATCTAAFTGPDADSVGDEGFDLLTVTVDGMYPSYHCKVSFDVTSTGSVPVHVELPTPDGTIPEWVSTDLDKCYTDEVQLEQGDSTGQCTVDIHFTNLEAPPEESGPFTFGWTILAHQWNEENEIVVESSLMYFSSTGWGGWSCPADHPYIVSGTTDCTLPLTHSLAWKPGASVDGVNYPATPFGYTYGAGEEGWIVQNGGTGQNCHILPTCSLVP